MYYIELITGMTIYSFDISVVWLLEYFKCCLVRIYLQSTKMIYSKIKNNYLFSYKTPMYF